MNKSCYVCENSSVKENYIFLCSICSQKTTYCSNCNKVLDIVLNSKLYKCFFCKTLVTSTKKEVHYNYIDDSSISNGRNQDEIYRQNILSLLQNKNIFSNSSTNYNYTSMNSNKNYNQFPDEYCKIKNEGIHDFTRMVPQSFQNPSENSFSANSGEFNEFYEKCNLKDQRLFVNQTIDLDHKLLLSKQGLKNVMASSNTSVNGLNSNRGSIKHQKSNSVFAVYNKSERLSASKSPTKRKVETNCKPISLNLADVSSYIQNYNEINLVDSRNTSFGTTANLSNSKPIQGNLFNNDQKTFFKNCNETLNFSNFSKK